MRFVRSLVASVLLLGCGDGAASPPRSGHSGELELTAAFMPEPPLTGRNAVTLELRDRAGAAVAGAALEIELWMPAHGHGSTSTPTVSEGDAGSYMSDDLIFTMPGQWEIRVLVGAGGLHDEFVFEREVR